MTAVIFGAGGQDGRLLKTFLERQKHTVFAVSRQSGTPTGDVADAQFVDDLLSHTKPDYIFQLAAKSTARHDALFANHNAISTGTLNVLESARKHCPAARIFIPGSALQFENSGSPIDESTPFEASSPYSLARIHATYASRYYRHAFGTKVSVGYLFHHDSPYRSEHHLSQKIAACAWRIGNGSGEILQIGDLDVEKEFNFAGDIVEAMWVLVQQDKVTEAIVGCGQAHSVREWISHCFGRIGKDWRDHVSVVPDYKADFKRSVSDPSRMLALGWSPKVGMQELADMMMAGHDLRL